MNMASEAGFTPADAGHMARAIALAERGRCTTHPNPRVGCVLVRDGVVIGTGWHQRAGGPHAEVAAITDAGGPQACIGATAYVTLEPCNHHGRTPPCVDALLAAGIARAVVASIDPDPRTAGAGIQRLAAAGVQVTSGLMSEVAAQLNRGFFSRLQRGRPFLTLKLAQSLDGRVALANGESRWVTGAAARRDVHRQRAGCDVILTGIGTVLADDPSLTVREGFETGRLAQPLRVVLDSRARLPAHSRLHADGGRTLLVHALPAEAGPGDTASSTPGATVPEVATPGALPALGIEAFVPGVTRWRVAGSDGRVDVQGLLQRLGSAGFNEVFAECGGTLAGALVDAGLVDELLLYVAPVLLGGEGRASFLLAPRDALATAPRWNISAERRVGSDLCLVLRPEPPP
jgi:diaminohydroxyphosphoribosylaminopyrimidine deaminase / 5-amino-6-(5-phosphoribosylamino)uracil reductase